MADVEAFARQVGTLAEMPLESAQLTGFKPEQVKTVMAARAHPTLRFFELSSNRLNGTTLNLLHANLFSRARGLDLWGNDFSKPAAAEALATVDLPKLERLSLCGTRLTDEGLARLAQSPLFARLTHLDLSANARLTLHGLEALRSAKSARWVSVIGAAAQDRAKLSTFLSRGARLRLRPEDPSVNLANFTEV